MEQDTGLFERQFGNGAVTKAFHRSNGSEELRETRLADLILFKQGSSYLLSKYLFCPQKLEFNALGIIVFLMQF